ncbi:MAG TPA: inositol monophosphatase family protein [Solirubrobacteraceae bacterium]|nr:inositol monophosphatase family protein [Solirubrobacteraceae bacterium]
MSTVEDDLRLALELADLADSITVARFRASDLVVDTKPDLTPVTEADRDVEQALRRHLQAARPGDSVLGEEYGTAPADESTRRWILDPIDGTKNYVRGVPVWATLIALEQDAQVTVGVVSAPALVRRWWAARGLGAFMREGVDTGARPLSVSAVGELAAAQLSFAGLEDWLAIDRLEAVVELTRRSWRTRSFGDFWAYMLVAEGAMEVALDPVVSLWDLAAPQVIVEEAGGRFSDLSGARAPDRGDAIATNGLVHDAALALIGRPRG